MDLIPIPVLAGSQAVQHSLAVQLRQCQAVYAAVPSEHNRYQVVRLERLLREILG
jgi:murein endopeptidase